MGSHLGHVAVIWGDFLISNLKQIFFKILKKIVLVDLCQLYNIVEGKKDFQVTA